MKLGIIGGSLLKSLDIFTPKNEEQFNTPFGEPSDNFITGTIAGCEVVFLNRHGINHHLAPHQINYKANLFVMKLLDVTHIVATMAVGGITSAMAPGRWVVPDQIIDYTHGRNHTYNDYDDKVIDHIDFTYPFDEPLRQRLITSLQQADIGHETHATYGATQGPRLETAAEIQRMKRDGCDIVGMTAMPEACLARELQIAYAGVSNVVNWAAGLTHGGEQASAESGTVSMEEIKACVQQGDKDLEMILRTFVESMSD
jgi:5'-methylthioadenosine phosphorylase/5'-methylthioinosine phosphorylase